jgi:hypothetical protein
MFFVAVVCLVVLDIVDRRYLAFYSICFCHYCFLPWQNAWPLLNYLVDALAQWSLVSSLADVLLQGI